MEAVAEAAAVMEAVVVVDTEVAGAVKVVVVGTEEAADTEVAVVDMVGAAKVVTAVMVDTAAMVVPGTQGVVLQMAVAGGIRIV